MAEKAKAATKAKRRAAPTQETAPGPQPARARNRRDVEVTVTLELGRCSCTLDELLQFGEQSLFELDKTTGDAIDILVNGRLCARGEVVTVSDHFGVRVTEIVDGEAGS